MEGRMIEQSRKSGAKAPRLPAFFAVRDRLGILWFLASARPKAATAILSH